jgi:hypothetical protein
MFAAGTPATSSATETAWARCCDMAALVAALPVGSL